MISFVVQGPITPWTVETCQSIRRYFPHSEIIVSTWKGERTDWLDCDKAIIANDDPGEAKPQFCKNVCRQIASSLAGIKLASHNLVCKVRSDTLFVHGDILSHWDRYNHFIDDLRLFERKALIASVGTMHPYRMNRPFHPSDFFMFGQKSDLLFWYDIPFAPKNATQDIAPEQYMSLKAIQKKFPRFAISRMDEKSEQSKQQTSSFFANNFVVLENAMQFGAIARKYELLCSGDEDKFDEWCKVWNKLYVHHIDWLEMYRNIGGIA